MSIFVLQIQSIMAGLTMNLTMLFVAYFVASFRSDLRGRSWDGLPTPAKLTSRIKCFATGIFLGILFVGLVPMVRSLVKRALEAHGIATHFPAAEALILCGFCATLLLEQLFVSSRQATGCAASLTDAGESTVALCKSSAGDMLLEEAEKEFAELAVDDVAVETHCHTYSTPAEVSRRPGVPEQRVMMLVASMGIHSLLEGLTLGLQENQPVLLRLLLGVYLHESLMLMAVGLSLGGLGLPTEKAVKIGTVMASMIPVGQVRSLKRERVGARK